MLTLSINGTDLQVDVPEDMPLLWVLRDVLGLTGSKYGCGIAQCGACTVHLDGQAARACVLPVGEVKGRKVVTIERIGNTELGRKVQQAWLEDEVVQCGYCQCGQIMSAVAVIEGGHSRTDDQIREQMSGNICRCSAYPLIVEAVKTARDRMI